MSRSASDLPRLIGVIHLPPLPGAPGAPRDEIATETLEIAGLKAIDEARILEKAGFDAIIVENYGDAPFFKDRVPSETIASLAILTAAVKQAIRIPLGVNVLRNDVDAALAIAAVSGCSFVRANVLAGVAATDQGLIEGDAAHWIRKRKALGCPVSILADAHVKHAQTLSSKEVTASLEDLFLRAGADGVVITGGATGKKTDPEQILRCSEVAQRSGIPLFIGSGATCEDLKQLRPLVYGVIVSSALRAGGKAGAALSPKLAATFAKAFRASVGTRKKPAPKRQSRR